MKWGHCLFGRNRIAGTLPNGDPKSIMVSGDILLYAPCAYPVGNDCTVLYKREFIWMNSLNRVHQCLRGRDKKTGQQSFKFSRSVLNHIFLNNLIVQLADLYKSMEKVSPLDMVTNKCAGNLLISYFIEDLFGV